jgi:SAM-dependent methyltransferase
VRFYDELADHHHLIFEDWSASIDRQASALASIIGSPPKRIADVAAGIGTQALGLAARGYEVAASDLSAGAIERLRREADSRGLAIASRVDDMLRLSTHADASADVVLACDNAVPHLVTDEEIRQAFVQFHRVLRPGGQCIVSVRDYAALPETPVRFNPQGVRELEDGKVTVFQVWEYEGDRYDLSQYFVFERGEEIETKVFKTKYYAVSIDRLMQLMGEAGFSRVQRIDGLFFQPLIVATAAPPARFAQAPG